MDYVKTIALVAHDNRKQDLLEWVRWNYKTLIQHKLVCTGTTGKLVQETITGLMEEGDRQTYPIIRLKSGPLGGDQQLGAMIAEEKVDILIFLWDPMEPQPHDVDVKALLRIAVLYNIPIANNRSTADFIISSELFKQQYQPIKRDYSSYLNRTVPGE
ncbi:methylglyoxal synthase [Spirochaetia bacterium 38H-sp]|uniref:Methylglyoxal synthase n=1 Tax=Rarispira pelagica TaxID=3141764 RepID=A0ABU9UDP2_9SPIR